MEISFHILVAIVTVKMCMIGKCEILDNFIL